MKILHISDVHGDLEALNAVRDFTSKRDDLEVLVCSGDLLGQCLTEEQAEQMQKACGYIGSTVSTEDPVPFGHVLEFLKKRSGDLPDSLKKAISDYIDVEQEFVKNAERQYQEIAEIFEQFPQTVFMVPGNWDSTHYFDYLSDFDIHKRRKDVDGVTFSGYGGDKYRPGFLPPTKAINYSEDESFEYLSDFDPDIAITHVPPRMIIDGDGNGRHFGSWANLAYVLKEAPEAVLCGHNHNLKHEKEETSGTMVSNPGNLGKYGDSPRTFVELERDREGFVKSTVSYKLDEDGEVLRNNPVDSRILDNPVSKNL